MKSYKSTYPVLRRSFSRISEIGEVINRSDSYIKKRMNGSEEFTRREKVLILDALAIEPTEANIREVFTA